MKARRAYRTLKGIIRLQALIRGHLVRRQAVSTLFCVQGIVKFQALIRGQRVRHSDIGVEVQKIPLVISGYLFNIIDPGVYCLMLFDRSKSLFLYSSCQMFCCKLLMDMTI